MPRFYITAVYANRVELELVDQELSQTQHGKISLMEVEAYFEKVGRVDAYIA